VLGASSRLDQQATLAVDRANKRRLERTLDAYHREPEPSPAPVAWFDLDLTRPEPIFDRPARPLRLVAPASSSRRRWNIEFKNRREAS
jgi:hypothetical protein